MEKQKIYRVLTINPGSTSTKIGVFDDEVCTVSEVIRHKREELENKNEEGVYWQKDLRKKLVLETLKKNQISLDTLDAVSGRTGRMPAMKSGTYEINEALLEQVPDPLLSPGALGMIIAKEIGDECGIPSYVVDSPTVDEMLSVAKMTGFPGIERASAFHALNQKAVARRVAKALGKKYNECRLIVAHLGGGISIGAHLYGDVIDSSNGNAGDGPFTPERVGSVPAVPLVKLCFSGKYSKEEIIARFTKNGGAFALLGTSDMREVEAMMADGNQKAQEVYDALVYNVCKTIGAMFAVMDGKVDAIILTGGLTYSELFCRKIKEKIGRFGEVIVCPGEDELLALAQGALRVLTGEETAHHFTV